MFFWRVCAGELLSKRHCHWENTVCDRQQFGERRKPFPTQVFGKCTKPFPTQVFGKPFPTQCSPKPEVVSVCRRSHSRQPVYHLHHLRVPASAPTQTFATEKQTFSKKTRNVNICQNCPMFGNRNNKNQGFWSRC